MNIENMTDQEKTVALARLVGWDVSIVRSAIGDRLIEVVIHVPDIGPITTLPPYCLYGEAHMALAWRVLNWINTTALSNQWNVWFYDQVWIGMTPAEAQKTWLDKVLEMTLQGDGKEAVAPQP